MICALCGKKQSSFSSGFLKDGIMICSDCQNDISAISKAAGEDLTQYSTLLTDFKTKCDSYESSPEAQKALEEILSKIQKKNEDNRDRLEREIRLADFLSTTGFDLQGYKIRKYVKVISGETVLGTGFLSEISASFSDFFGAQSAAFSAKLEKAKDASMQKVFEKADSMGANALIGVNFNYIKFSGNLIGVIANATAVIVEPE